MKHEPMTQERLDAIRARLSDVGAIWKYAATPTGDGEVITVGQEGPIAWGIDIDSAALIAHAPQDLADLLAEVERLRARLTVDDAMVERAKRAFGAAAAQVSSIPLGMSEDMFIDSVGLQHQHAIRAVLDAALGTGEGA